MHSYMTSKAPDAVVDLLTDAIIKDPSSAGTLLTLSKLIYECGVNDALDNIKKLAQEKLKDKV